jgi:hypothetical protein
VKYLDLPGNCNRTWPVSHNIGCCFSPIEKGKFCGIQIFQMSQITFAEDLFGMRQKTLALTPLEKS